MKSPKNNQQDGGLSLTTSDLLAVIRAAEAAVPEGYRIAKDTLPERVKLMAEGLMSFMADREGLRRENAILRGALEDIGEYTGEGGPGTPWRDIVRDCGNKARDAISSANNKVSDGVSRSDH